MLTQLRTNLNWLALGACVLGLGLLALTCRSSCKPAKPDRTGQIIEGVGGITNAILEAEVRKAEAEARRAAAEAEARRKENR